MRQEPGFPGRNQRLRNRLDRTLARTGIALGILWALPLTLFGLLLSLPALLNRNNRLSFIRHRTPALLLTGPLIDQVLSRHPLGGVTAMALGHLVIARRHALSTRLIEHELTHVRQAARWGCVFPLVYLAASVWEKCRGRQAYWDNIFEVDARKAERQVEPDQTIDA